MKSNGSTTWEASIRNAEKGILENLSKITILYIQAIERFRPNAANNHEIAALESRINLLGNLNLIIKHLMHNEEARDRDPFTDPEALPNSFRFLTEDHLIEKARRKK